MLLKELDHIFIKFDDGYLCNFFFSQPHIDDEADAKAFIAAIRSFNAKMKIPEGFDFILDKDIPQMVAWASKEANPVYPVPVVYDAARFTAVIQKIRIPVAHAQAI